MLLLYSIHTTYRRIQMTNTEESMPPAEGRKLGTIDEICTAVPGEEERKRGVALATPPMWKINILHLRKVSTMAPAGRGSHSLHEEDE